MPGPKPKPDDQKMSSRLQIRMFPDQRKRYEKAAERAGMSITAWIKKTLDARVKKG